MFQIGDWVTQYSVGYWQVVDIKAKYAEEDSGYGKQFWKKGEQIGIEKEKKVVIKKLHELNISIEQIAKVVELKEEEVKEILNDKKA